jgi:hypothetical protein
MKGGRILRNLQLVYIGCVCSNWLLFRFRYKVFSILTPFTAFLTSLHYSQTNQQTNWLEKLKRELKYPCNRSWRPMRLWGVEAPTFSRSSARRWRWGFQRYAVVVNCFPGRFLVLIPSRGLAETRAIGLVQLKKHWPNRVSNPRPSGLQHSYSISYSIACPLSSNWKYDSNAITADRLCGLVVRQSSWLHNGDVLCFLWDTNCIYICHPKSWKLKCSFHWTRRSPTQKI